METPKCKEQQQQPMARRQNRRQFSVVACKLQPLQVETFDIFTGKVLSSHTCEFL
jgi:hypothetical protein